MSVPEGTFVFQSTHPHRVRPTINGQPSLVAEFQSTHPHRVRLKGGRVKLDCDKFQSTHPHRVRHYRSRLYVQDDCFNPRTHIGCDLGRDVGSKDYKYVSIHAPT